MAEYWRPISGRFLKIRLNDKCVSITIFKYYQSRPACLGPLSMYVEFFFLFIAEALRSTALTDNLEN